MNKSRLILSREDVISPVELVRQLNRFMEPHGIKFERIGVSGIELEVTSYWEMITELRDEEGSTVTIICDNADFNGQPDRAIECCGAWTGWQDVRFAFDKMEDCLKAAVEARRKFYKEKELPHQGAA